MPFIVTLSSIHTLHPVNKSINAFANLYNEYSDHCCSACPGFFKNLSNYAKVLYDFKKCEDTLIRQYKLGIINTYHFFEHLLAMFPFLENADIKPEVLANLNEGEFYTETSAFALLENAWNSGISMEFEHVNRFRHLVNIAPAEPIYLISNTNELNVLKILKLLKQANPDLEFNSPIDLSITESKIPVELAPNIYLCLSYRYQLFKTTEENEKAHVNATMSMMNYLIKELLLDGDIQDIKLISQYKTDYIEAKKLGVKKQNIFNPDDFFSENSLNTIKALKI